MSVYWLLRREYARWQWRRGRVTFGQFCDLLEGAPEWLRRDTSPWWRPMNHAR